MYPLDIFGTGLRHMNPVLLQAHTAEQLSNELASGLLEAVANGIWNCLCESKAIRAERCGQMESVVRL
jgi:hypothetical protein